MSAGKRDQGVPCWSEARCATGGTSAAVDVR